MESARDLFICFRHIRLRTTGETATGRILPMPSGGTVTDIFTDDWNCDGVYDPEILIDDTGASFTGTGLPNTNVDTAYYQLLFCPC